MSKLAVVELKLVRPYNQSVETLYKLVNLWKLNLIQSGTRSEKAIIEIPEDKFEKIFGEEPSTGEWEVPNGTQGFISEFKVTKIKKVKE
jgi:hypothetical protein